MYKNPIHFIFLACALIVSLSYHSAVFCEEQLGVSGAKNTKVGIGHMGMIKAREADDSLIINGSQFYYDNYPSRESYLVFPCLKIAQLIAEHVVLNLSLELGGTIIPRFGSEMDSWRPSIGVDILYSFGKLSGPNLMDGTF